MYKIADFEITAPLKLLNGKCVVKGRFGKGEPERVLKIDIFGGEFVYANVLGGQWIHSLNLPGVTAPEMWLCEEFKDHELDNIIGQLKGLQQLHQEEFRKLHIREGDPDKLKSSFNSAQSEQARGIFSAAMVSELVKGEPVGEVLGRYRENDDVKSFQNVTYQAVLNADSKDQTVDKATLKATLATKLKEASKVRRWLIDVAKLTNAHTPPKDLDNFVADFDTENRQEDKLQFELQVLLERLHGEEATNAHKAVENARKQVEQLKKYQSLLSKKDKDGKGTDAFIRMAAVDVILGMNDRVITKFNDTNFRFGGDGKHLQLICTDNAKEGPHLYNRKLDYEGWFNSTFPTLAGTLTQTLQKHLELLGVDGTELVTLEDVEQILDEVAKRTCEVASGEQNKEEETKEIERRARYVIKRVEEEKELARVLQLAPIKARDQNFGEMVSRALKSLGLRQEDQKWKQDVEVAHEVKEKVRKGDISKVEELSQAKTSLAAVDDSHAREKAELELGAKLFIYALEQATEAQQARPWYTPSKKLKDTVFELVQQWKKSGTYLGPNIEAAYQSWSTAIDSASNSSSSSSTAKTATPGSMTSTLPISTASPRADKLPLGSRGTNARPGDHTSRPDKASSPGATTNPPPRSIVTASTTPASSSSSALSDKAPQVITARLETAVVQEYNSEGVLPKAKNATLLPLGSSLRPNILHGNQTAQSAPISTSTMPRPRKSPQYPPPPPSTPTSVTIAKPASSSSATKLTVTARQESDVKDYSELAKTELQNDGWDLTRHFLGATNRQLSVAYKLYVHFEKEYTISSVLEGLMNGDLSESGTWKN